MCACTHGFPNYNLPSLGIVFKGLKIAMLIKTKQNKNGNLVCLARLSELEKQTSSQKDKHTHSKHGEGAARRRENLQTREQWKRTQPGREGKGTSCQQGEQEGKDLSADLSRVGERTFSFVHTLLQPPPDIPTIKAHTCEATSEFGSSHPFLSYYFQLKDISDLS